MANIDWTQILEWKSADQLVALVGQKLAESGSKLTNWNKLSRLRTLTESLVQPTAELFVLLLKVVPQIYAKYATGEWLDLHAADRDDARKEGRAAIWLVQFARTEGGSGNVPILAGTRVGTQLNAQGLRVEFVTRLAAVLLAEEDVVDVEVEATEVGVIGNVGLGTINVLLNPVAGIAGVTNIGLVSEGVDRESDEALSERLVAKWDALGYGSNRAAYRLWALGVAGVLDAWVDDDHPRGPGTVDVYVLATTGSPSVNLLAEVDGVVQSRRTVCANVLVKGPDLVPIEVEGTVYIGPDARAESAVLADVNAATAAYFHGTPVVGVNPIKIAEDYRPNKIVHLLMGIDGVVDVVLADTSNVIVGAGALAVLDGESAFAIVRVTNL